MAVCHYQVVVAVVQGTMCFIEITKYVHLTMSVAGSLYSVCVCVPDLGTHQQGSF